ncbi:MAG TPA: hypothetical protein VHD56_08710 [Tepidisphaeraceae bacterium]|nr:hypothetical protein [Tepidisphaeraceae bacterium]
MIRSFTFSVLAGLSLVSLSACASTRVPMIGKAAIHEDSNAALAKAQMVDPYLKSAIQHSAGYAVFSSVNKDALGSDKVYAKGTLYEYGTIVGTCDLKQIPAGSQANVTGYTEIIIFPTEQLVYSFKQGNLQFDEGVKATALEPGATAYLNEKPASGVSVFTTGNGIQPSEMASVVKGQTFNYKVLDRTNPLSETVARNE